MFYICFLHQWTPLHVAASNGTVKIVSCLVEDGKADITIKDDEEVSVTIIMHAYIIYTSPFVTIKTRK